MGSICKKSLLLEVWWHWWLYYKSSKGGEIADFTSLVSDRHEQRIWQKPKITTRKKVKVATVDGQDDMRTCNKTIKTLKYNSERKISKQEYQRRRKEHLVEKICKPLERGNSKPFIEYLKQSRSNGVTQQGSSYLTLQVTSLRLKCSVLNSWTCTSKTLFAEITRLT